MVYHRDAGACAGRNLLRLHRRLGRVFIVASEGLVDEKGEYLTAQTGRFATDAFGGHRARQLDRQALVARARSGLDQ